MTKHSWVNGSCTGRAVVCLGAMLVAAMGTGRAMASSHPVRYAEASVAHHGSAAKAKAGKNAARKTKSRASEKPLPKAGAHKRHRSVEADNDPPTIYRTGAHTGTHAAKPRHTVAPPKPMQAVAGRRESSVPAATAPSGDDLLAMSAAVTASDFKRDNEPATAKAEPAAVAKTTAPGEGIEQLSDSPVVATASAIPTTGPAVTLPTRGKAKASPLPEDQAGRAALVEEIVQPVVLRPLYTRSGRLIVPPPMKGSRDILIHQNTMADSEGLDRIQDDTDLDRMRAAHLLVPLEDSKALQVNGGLPENRRYARPWTVRFAADTARAFYARFHQPLHLSSAVRTVEYQLRLQQVNGNAAAVDGDAASPHLTGQALDFGKHGMSMAQIAWMRAYLGPLMQSGKVDVEEEFQQACFHISVYRNYAPLLKPAGKASPKLELAQTDAPAHAALRARTLR